MVIVCVFTVQMYACNSVVPSMFAERVMDVLQYMPVRTGILDFAVYQCINLSLLP